MIQGGYSNIDHGRPILAAYGLLRYGAIQQHDRNV